MILFHLIMVYFIFIAPIWGYVYYQRFKKDIAVNPHNRAYYYKMWSLELWIVTAIFAIGVWWVGVNLVDLGFVGIELNEYMYGVFVGVSMMIILPIILYRRSPKYRERTDKQFQNYNDFLPVTTRDKWNWAFLSLTAGVCEELLFRAFMFYYIQLLLPELSIWWVVAITSIIFGLGHTYQGVSGVLTTTFMGFVFAKVYLFTGSILVGIIIHFLVDLRILFMLPKKEKTEIEQTHTA